MDPRSAPAEVEFVFPSPSVRRVIAAVERLVAGEPAVLSVDAPPRCGWTFLAQTLVKMNGFADNAVESFYFDFAPDHRRLTACREIARLNARQGVATLLILDRGVRLPFPPPGCHVLRAGRSASGDRRGRDARIAPLSRTDTDRFFAAAKTQAGLSSVQSIEDAHRQTGGRIADLAQRLRAA